MRVLMISLDKGMVGGPVLGDVIERHKRYGEYVEALDIIVLSKKGFEQRKISENVFSYPTNSFSKIVYVRDAVRIGSRLFADKKYDLIVTQDPFAAGLAGKKLKEKFGCKLLIHFHGDFWENPNWLKESALNRFLLPLSKKVVPAADGIRVMSESQKAKLVKSGISAEKIKVIATPVKIERLISYPDDPEHKKQIQELIAKKGKSRVVLMVGRRDKAKDFSTLFKTFANILSTDKNVKFWLIGNYIASEVPADIRANTEGFPYVSAEDLPAYYYAADIAVLSSTSESFGKVLVEANACGKPVASTDTSGAREIIRQGYNGYLVPVGNFERLAERILHVLNYPILAKQFGENGQKLARERFGDNLNKVVEFWKEIVNS